jgi:hypothetical protein
MKNIPCTNFSSEINWKTWSTVHEEFWSGNMDRYNLKDLGEDDRAIIK